MDGLREWLAEQNGNLVNPMYADAITNDPVPRGFVRVDGDEYVLAPVSKPGKFNMRDVVATLEAVGLDPFKHVAEAVKGGKLDAKDQVAACLGLAPYIAPKLQSVEMKVDAKPEYSDTELAARVASLLDGARARRAKSAPGPKALGSPRRPAKGSVRKPS